MHGDWSVSDREGKTVDERRYEGENNGCKRLYNYIINSIGTIDKVNVFKYFFSGRGNNFPNPVFLKLVTVSLEVFKLKSMWLFPASKNFCFNWSGVQPKYLDMLKSL